MSVTWKLVNKNVAGTSNEYCGASLSLSGDGYSMIVGCPWYSDAYLNVGRVRMFSLVSGNWTPMGSSLTGSQTNENYGTAVGMSTDGLTVVIGSPYYSGVKALAGRVQVFWFDSGSDDWTQLGTQLEGSLENELFGQCVAISGDGATIASLSLSYASDVFTTIGKLSTYYNSGGTWMSKVADIFTNDNDFAGSAMFFTSVALNSDGSKMVLGSRGYDASFTDSGQVTLYTDNIVSWAAQQDFQGSSGEEQFGTSVALSSDGSTVAMGAPYYNSTQRLVGRAEAYRYNSNADQFEILDNTVTGSATKDRCGSAVALSANGSIFAMSCPGSLSSSGKVKVFSYRAATWEILDSVLTASSTYQFGMAMSMSNDGQTLVVSALSSTSSTDGIVY
eukprot:gene19005-13712_t